MKCIFCGRATTETRMTREIRIGDHVVRGSVPGEKCTSCKETYAADGAMERLGLQLASQVARSGNVSGDTFRFMRKALGLQAKELGEVIGTPVETISRWEKGARDVDRFAWAAVAGIVIDHAERRAPVTKQLFGAMRRPAALPKSVKVA